MENKRKIEEIELEHKEEHINSRKRFNYLLILLAIVTLLIGGTYAYFLFTVGTGDVEVQATPDVSLSYSDNDTNMKEDLIPTSRENAVKGLLKTSDKCVDSRGFSACSLYEFTVTNDSDVSQVINITMTPTENGYQNLEYSLYQGTMDELDENSTPIVSNQKLAYNSLAPITFNDITETILASDDISYTIMFYLYDTGKNQVTDDSDKSFRANIRINSITTGQYINKEING